MLQLDVKTDIAMALKGLYTLEPRQFPFIASLAINRTSKRVKEDLRKSLAQVFDRPTPFTLNSLRSAYATKDNLTSLQAIAGSSAPGLRDWAGKGTPASKYLSAQIDGGSRRMKRFERYLQQRGILPSGMAVVPAKGSVVPMDPYGNVPGRYFQTIMSSLEVPSGPLGQGQRARNRAALRMRFYVVGYDHPKHTRLGLPVGIYERVGNISRMVLAFVKAPTYAKRFPFYQIAQETAVKHFPTELRNAIDYALRTSREGKSLRLQDFTDVLDNLSL